MQVDFSGVCPLLQVFDMPIALAFYREVLGFMVINQSDGEMNWCHLSREGAEIMLNTMYESDRRPAQPDGARTAAHHDTGLYFACRDLDAAYEHLLSHGVQLSPPKTVTYGMRQLYFKDPDGYCLCFQWPANEKWAHQWRERYGFDV